MPSITDQVRAIAEPKVMEALDKSKAAFIDQFGDWVDAIHKDELADHFKKAGKCKLKALLESDQAKARQYAEAAELHMKAIETLGLGGKIVTKAKSASALAATAGIILDTLGDVVLAVIKTIASGLVSGAVQGLVGGEGGTAEAVGDFLG
jgi:hypothetical protein